MEHLINKTEISTLARPISGNIADGRVDGYITEAEMSIIKPAIGDALYLELLDSSAPSDAQKLLLDGGKYDVDGKIKVLNGLKVAVAYYVYAKLVKNNSINVTSASVVQKLGDHSTAIDTKHLMRVHDDAVDYGNMCMGEVLQLLRDRAADYPSFAAGAKTPAQRSVKSTITAIGD